MTQEENKTTPEQKIRKIALRLVKKTFLILFVCIGYLQAYDFISESPEITVVLEESARINKTHKTLLSVENGSESVSKDDIVQPIKLTFNDSILQIDPKINEINPKFEVQNKSLNINFDLLNKNEKFQFYVTTTIRPQLVSTECRIKNIKCIKNFDSENKPKPLSRILNIWLILFVLSIVFFVDALLVIVKDKELGNIKHFVKNFPLKQDNIEEFLNGYEAVYKTYRVRIKPDPKFMRQIIANLFLSFKHQTDDEIAFIKTIAHFKTEYYVFYRIRTAFVIISPIVIIISLLGSLFNYYYYEFDILKTAFSLSDLNLILVRILLVVSIFIIIFPRRTMTFFFVKRGGHPF